MTQPQDGTPTVPEEDQAPDDEVSGHLYREYYGPQVEGRWAGRRAGADTPARPGPRAGTAQAAPGA